MKLITHHSSLITHPFLPKDRSHNTTQLLQDLRDHIALLGDSIVSGVDARLDLLSGVFLNTPECTQVLCLGGVEGRVEVVPFVHCRRRTQTQRACPTWYVVTTVDGIELIG